MHKVCGEYISMESKPFLMRLGFDFDKIDLPIIGKVSISSPNGNILHQNLDLGGFGISRYVLEDELASLARKSGVEIIENNKVFKVKFEDDSFEVQSAKGIYSSRICIGSHGKYGLTGKYKNSGQNYIGVKYHIRNEKIAVDTIALHNFKGGYCGVSRIEAGKACLCYLTTSGNLKRSNNSIESMEKNVLFQNKYLKELFENSEFIFDKPLVISNVTFEAKSPVVENILMAGDSAGAIAPLCGNGMSMAFRSADILSNLVDEYFKNNISREILNNLYTDKWQELFGKRIKTGYYLQKLFGRNFMTNVAIKLLSKTPEILQRLIKMTHGRAF